jgi:hypothetical protein
MTVKKMLFFLILNLPHDIVNESHAFTNPTLLKLKEIKNAARLSRPG